MKHKLKNIKQRGFIFLEILIASALISIVFITLLGIGFSSLNLAGSIQKTTEADTLIKEEFEAVRSFRDGTIWITNGLATLNTGSLNPYYFSINTVPNPDTWVANMSTETTGAFTRNIVFDKVSRDLSTKNIENPYNATHDDPNTRKATVTVTWQSKTYQVVSYFTNWNQ